MRASAVAGLGAFALSVIIALFSRVPFGTLLLRAFALGLGFAAAAYGIHLLFRKFMPELLGEAPPADDRAGAGSLVDIMVRDGDAEQPSAADGIPEDSEGTPGPAPHPAYSAAGPGDAPADAQPGSLRAARPVFPPRDDQAIDEDMQDLEREVEDIRAEALIPREVGDAGQSDKPARPSVALDELDVLPDLDGMSDSFSQDVVASNGPGGDDPAGFAPSGSGSGGGDADPAALAKAVQTLLRRDQKG